MGLDIYHQKAVLEKEKEYDWEIRLEENYQGFNVLFSHFEKYIQKVDSIRKETEIKSVIVNNESYLEEAKKSYESLGYKVFFGESDGALNDEIEKFEKQKNIVNYKKFRSKSNSKWHILTHFKTEKKTGFYVKDFGHQRKGMSNDFYEKFYVNNVEKYGIDCFAMKEDFEFAYSCISPFGNSDEVREIEQIKLSFKKEFIDNFELGASFMHTSF